MEHNVQYFYQFKTNKVCDVTSGSSARRGGVETGRWESVMCRSVVRLDTMVLENIIICSDTGREN